MVEKGKTEGKMVMAAANSGGLGTDGMAAYAGLGTECQERHGRAPDRRWLVSLGAEACCRDRRRGSSARRSAGVDGGR